MSEWIASKYYEKFWSNKFIDAINKGEKDKALKIWKEEVVDKPVCSVEDFKKFFNKLHEDGIKKFWKESKNKFVITMVQIAYILKVNVWYWEDDYSYPPPLPFENNEDILIMDNGKEKNKEAKE